jgi:hypothetical protein
MHKIFRSENLKGTDRSEDIGVDDRIILKGFQGNMACSCGLDESV